MPAARNVIVTLVGKKGAGKTTELRRLVRASRRLVVLDPECTWEPMAWRGRADRVVWSARQLVDAARAGRWWNQRARFRVIYRDTSADVLATWGPRLVYELRGCTLVVDELARVCSSTRLPPWLEALLAVGRHRRVNLLGTTREPQEIHDRFFSQADLLYLFRIDPGNGLDRLRRRYGRELTDGLPGLEVGEFRNYGTRAALELIGREGA